MKAFAGGFKGGFKGAEYVRLHSLIFALNRKQHRVWQPNFYIETAEN
jgi:hypothetical protein